MALNQDQHREALITSLSIQFARASGYELTENNTNQWRLAIEMLVRGIEQLVTHYREPMDSETTSGETTSGEFNTAGELTMKHSDIKS